MNKSLSEIFPKVPQDIDLSCLDINKIPKHVAIIMDVKKVKSSSKTEEKGSGFEVGFEEDDFEAMIKQKHSPRPINSIGLYERQSKDIRTGFLENIDSKLFKGKSIRISEV